MIFNMPDTNDKPNRPPCTARPRHRAIVFIGRWIGRFGQLSVPLGLGAMLGFYAADRGMRWLPSMLELVLAVFVLGFVAMPLGRLLQGRLYTDTIESRRVRKRVVFWTILATLCAGGRLALYWAEKPTALTAMSAAEFNRAFESDLQRYRELDAGLSGAVAFLERQHMVFNPDAPRVLKADEERSLMEVWRTIHDYAFALDQIRIHYEDWYRFDPSRTERSFHMRSYLLTYAAELALYEKSTRLVRLVKRNKNAVKFLNAPHPPHNLPADSFGRWRQEFQGVRDQARVIAGEQYLRWLDKGLGGRSEAMGLGCGRLWERIENHIRVIDAISPLDKTKLTLGSDLQSFKRAVRRTWLPAQGRIAEWMGDTRVRRIGNYLITPAQQEELDKRLEPGDILLSRKNWYLSNVGLPGFWPHAILYIGDNEKFEAYFDDAGVHTWVATLSDEADSLGELIAERHPRHWLRYQLGADGHPHRVIEAISDGVVLNTLAHASGDYLAAVRPRLDKRAKAQAILEAFGHLGKPYDYEFDFATDHALVCTELVWRSYRPAAGKAGLNFPLVKVMGRQTLPANEIVAQFARSHDLSNAQLEFVYFLDANEKRRSAFETTEEAFLSSSARTKWDIALD